MAEKHHLAALQLAIMQVLWQRGEATVAEVRQALCDESRPLAHTTVGTMLAKMEKKGQVTHRSDGRVNVYRPSVGRERVSRSMVSDLARRLFGGDVTEMVSHLLDGCEVSDAELTRLKDLIQRKQKESRHGD
jgi:predicted transcriptional regulator